jgi:hypothetical protein
MKRFISLLVIGLIILAIAPGCEDFLKEEIYSELDPEGLLGNSKGAEATLFSAYGVANLVGHDGKSIMNLEDWSTDIEWETGGGENRTAVLMINFTWDASTDWIVQRMWNRTYRAIRNANVVIENLSEELPEADRTLFMAEARFIRAVSYYRLWTWFGPPVLRTSLSDPGDKARATEEEFRQFLETEFTGILPDLPDPGQERAYGRAHKGAAMAYLVKFFLNSKQWQKCADMADQLIGKGWYELYPVYEDLFKVENEMTNKEFIWVSQGTTLSTESGCQYMNGARPIAYKSLVNGDLELLPGMANWAAQYRIYDSFYNSFEDGDHRRNLIISEFINTGGDTVSLLDADNTRSFKYWPDPVWNVNSYGNDHPDIRYADILLARAEALNNLSGPNQESIDLINEVRTRAGLPDLNLSDFATTGALNAHILKERGWEFYNERKRRQDLIRHNRYWQSAQERGITNASAHHVVFPIPQTEIDANQLAEQNTGY